MATISSPSDAKSRVQVAAADMWTSLAIGLIWMVVLVDALFGPDIVSSGPTGFTRVPSAIVLGFFAWLATWVIARHGFGRRRDRAD